MPQNIPPPPPGFTLDTPSAPPSPSLGRPILRKGVEPPAPPSGYRPTSNGLEYIPGGPADPDLTPPKKAEAPSGYRFTANGNLEVIPGGPADEKNAGDPLQQAVKGLGLDELLYNSKRARGQIDKTWATGVLGGLSGMAPYPGSDRKDFLATLQSLQGGIILEKLQALKDASKTGASGMGALSEKEGERLAAAVAAVNGDMSGDELIKSLDVIDRHAKILQAIGEGENPDDPEVQRQFGILPLPDAGSDKPRDELPQPNLAPSAGETRSIIDPKKQELGGKIAGLMSRGADRNTIMGFAVRADPSLRTDPAFRAWVDKAIAHRSKHPGAKFTVDPSFYTSEVPLTAEEQQSNETAQSGLGSAIAHFGDAATAGNMGNLASLVGGDGDQVRQALAAQSQINPKASMAGDVGGGVLAALGGEAALARAGMNPGVVRGLIADGGYGGLSGGTNSDSDNFLGKLADAGKGALAAGAGSLVGQGALRVPGKALAGVTNPTVSYVSKEIPGALTLGQAVSQSGRVGSFVKNVEDKIAGSGLDGGLINARRTEGLQKMNSKAFDRALEPISENVAGGYGEDAVSVAQEKVSQAFRKALAGKSANLDREFIVDATKAKMAIEKLPDRVNAEVNSSVDEVINSYFDDSGNISGENLQALLRDLQGVKKAYASDPLGHRIGKAVEQVSESVEGLFHRQAPEVMPQYNAAKLAFKRLSTIEDAVLRGKNTGGVFTPAQLGMADRANTIRFGGKHKAAAGGGEFHEFQRNMQEVLPNKVPDSGTAGRILPIAAVLGAGAGADYATGSSGAGLGLAGLLTLAYTRKGQGLLRLATRPGGAKAKAVGRTLQKGGRGLGAAVSTQAALGTSRDQ